MSTFLREDDKKIYKKVEFYGASHIYDAVQRGSYRGFRVINKKECSGISLSCEKKND